jgi:hypothetical protein
VHGVIDTLVQAKEMHPGKRNSLDALCDRYGIRTPTASCTARCWTRIAGRRLPGHDAWPEQPGHGRGSGSGAADGAALEIVPLAEVIFQSATPDELAAHEATWPASTRQPRVSASGAPSRHRQRPPEEKQRAKFPAASPCGCRNTYAIIRLASGG